MKKEELNKEQLIGISALLIHAAKIDENYTNKEKIIITTFIKSHLQKNNSIDEIFEEAENLEKNSNQLLSFTNLIKENSLDLKTKIIKELWRIILSDNKSDSYESNLIRRICGLIYFPDTLSGEIKMQLQNEDDSK